MEYRENITVTRRTVCRKELSAPMGWDCDTTGIARNGTCRDCDTTGIVRNGTCRNCDTKGIVRNGLMTYRTLRYTGHVTLRTDSD